MSGRNTDRVRYRYGFCLNDNCEKCKSKEVQEIPARKEFVCQNPECGKPLRECPPPKKGGKAKLFGIIAGVVALLAVACFFIFGNRTPKIESFTIDKDSIILKPGQSERINVTIDPKELKPELVWQSSEENVATVRDGVILAKKEGKATVKVFPKDQIEISAICEVSVVMEDVDMETLDIQEEPIILRPGGHQQLTVKCTPENQNETITWSSSDESIVKVIHKGKIEAIKVGEVSIIAKSNRTGIADTAKVIVEGPAEMLDEKATETKTPETKPAVTPAPKPTASGSKNLGYATFKGTWPNDVNGRMVFTSSHVIDSKDPRKRVAEAGDYIIGEWSDGHLVQGIWYGADNTVKGSVIIGK